MSSRRWRESIRVPCTPPACSSPTAPSSAPPIRSRAPSARCCPRSCTRRCCRARCATAPSRTASERPRTVGWAIAACLAARTDLLRELGPFDPAVHLFAEDMELGLRARARGVPTVLHPHLRVRHTGGHSVHRDGEPHALLARRRREAVGSALGPRARALDDVAQLVTFATRIGARAALGRDASRERAQLAALRREIGS